MTGISAQERAERVRDVMWGADAASRWFGMVCEYIAPGEAVVSMRLEPHHCNGHKTCHGGVSFALADSAFALACNSHNQVAVAQHNSMSYIAPGFAGDTLSAHAVERARFGRSGVYDVSVTNQKGELIAEFRGGSRVIRGQHFEESAR
ncbi:MAG: hydroxyphenylacetyl-CoA thioesterase PaaI [Rhodobacteraceae bacterium]|nr:hydroxyphenylacetyl-CoA thioesterase PaaI [Paracoccaceae bacterium]